MPRSIITYCSAVAYGGESPHPQRYVQLVRQPAHGNVRAEVGGSPCIDCDRQVRVGRSRKRPRCSCRSSVPRMNHASSLPEVTPIIVTSRMSNCAGVMNCSSTPGVALEGQRQAIGIARSRRSCAPRCWASGSSLRFRGLPGIKLRQFAGHEAGVCVGGAARAVPHHQSYRLASEVGRGGRGGSSRRGGSGRRSRRGCWSRCRRRCRCGGRRGCGRRCRGRCGRNSGRGGPCRFRGPRGCCRPCRGRRPGWGGGGCRGRIVFRVGRCFIPLAGSKHEDSAEAKQKGDIQQSSVHGTRTLPCRR